MRRHLVIPQAGAATPLAEPLSPPIRPAGVKTRRVGVNLDLERYVNFKAFCALHGMTGEQVIIAALDRLMSGR